MTVLKERRWELMEVGEEFGPLDVEVTQHLVKSFAYSVEDLRPRYLSGADSCTGQPTLLCREARDVIRTGYDITSGGAGMHVKHEVWIDACPVVGQRVRITGRHVEKYLKREKQYVVLESEVRTDVGGPVLRQRSTHIRALRPGVAKEPQPTAHDRPEGPTMLGVAVADTAADLAPGVQLRPLTKLPEQEHLTVFAGTEWRNIHNDPEVARAAGLRDSVASGLQTTAYVSELMERYCGDGWRSGAHLAVAFTAPLFVGEVVHSSGRVTAVEREGDRRRLHVEVWSETDAGTRVLAGTAEGWLPD